MATTVARSVRLFADQALSPAALSAYLATEAKRLRDEVIAAGDAPNSYRTFVDGREGAPETSVRPDGSIRYKFNLLGLAVLYALTLCIARSPVKDGDYKRAWQVIVGGKPWAGNIEDIPGDAEAMIVNPLPYARKIDVGAVRMSVPPQIIEAARQSSRRRYPTLNFERAFVTIPPGVFPGAPYILKGHAHRVRAIANNRSRAHREGRAFLMPRKDTMAGQKMTYPALVITPV